MRDVYFTKHFIHPKTEEELKSVLSQKDLSVVFQGQKDHPNFHDIVDWSMSHIALEPQFVVFSQKSDLLKDLRNNHAALYRKSDKSLHQFTKTHYNKHTLEQWIYAHSHQSLGKLDATGYQRMIHDRNAALVLFARDSIEEERLMKQYNYLRLADKNYQKILVMSCK